MNGIAAFVQMLEREETAVDIQETADTRYFVANYQFLDDEREYIVEFFDGVPVVLSWTVGNGRVRLNREGMEF